MPKAIQHSDLKSHLVATPKHILRFFNKSMTGDFGTFFLSFIGNLYIVSNFKELCIIVTVFSPCSSNHNLTECKYS